MIYTIKPIFRENLPNAFGVWFGGRKTVFGLSPLAVFETEEEAQSYIETIRQK